MIISIIGGNARNKGALLMLSAAIEIINVLPIKKLYIFTPFPDEDKYFINSLTKQNKISNFSIVKWDQKNILYALCSKILQLKFGRINKALKESDYVFDISGISFVTNRGFKYLIYNSLTIYLPVLNKATLIKLPQSFGPLNGTFYRFVAKYFLKKCYFIFSRGSLSKTELENIGIPSTLSPDLGFLYNKNFQTKPFRNIVGINPSTVIEKHFIKSSIDYQDYLENLIIQLSNESSKIIIFPQSYREKASDNIFNDVEIIKKLKNKINLANVEFILEDLDLNSLFKIYDEIDICITSRFHAMIMSMVTNKIPIVVGWNHKYKEVLNSVQLSELNLEINQNLLDDTFNKYKDVSRNYSKYVNRLNTFKPDLTIAKEISKFL